MFGGRRRRPDASVTDAHNPFRRSTKGDIARSYFILPRRRHRVDNQTPHDIVLTCGAADDVQELVLPALQSQTRPGDELMRFESQLQPLRERHDVSLVTRYDRGKAETRTSRMVDAAVVALCGSAMVSLIARATWSAVLVALCALAVATSIAARAIAHRRAERQRAAESAPFADLLDEPYVVDHAGPPMTLVLPACAIAVVAVVLPLAGLAIGTSIADLLEMGRSGIQSTDGGRQLVVGALIAVTYAAILGALPGLLFFQFERSRANDRWTSSIDAIFQLDPRMRGLDDVYAMYGDLLSDWGGRGIVRRFRLQQAEPAFVLTILMALGWTFVVVTAFDGSLDQLLSRSASGDVFFADSGSSGLAGAGFLGSYFFVLYSLLREYFGGYLAPRAYIASIARVAFAVALAFLADIVLPSEVSDARWSWALVFVLGGFPGEPAARRAESVVRRLLGASHAGAGGAGLLDLDGLDAAGAVRLQEEGISDVASLADSDIISLVLMTRLPAARVVDWADQAVLRTALADEYEQSIDACTSRGIRTASDALASCDSDSPIIEEQLCDYLRAHPTMRAVLNWRSQRS